jgi:hypothetical protein
MKRTLKKTLRPGSIALAGSGTRSEGKSMTKNIRMFLILAAAAAAFGVSGQRPLAAQDTVLQQHGAVMVGTVAPYAVSPDAVAMLQGNVGVGENPPVRDPNPSWPCPGGGKDPSCSSIAAGGLVIPFPYQEVAENFSGEVFETFTSVTASGTAHAKVVVTQGTKTLFTDEFTFDVAPNGLYYAYVYDATLSKGAPGEVTVTFTVTVGTSTITGKTGVSVVE